MEQVVKNQETGYMHENAAYGRETSPAQQTQITCQYSKVTG